MKGMFPQFRQVEDSLISEIINTGTIVLDTNILFSLYRQTTAGREQLFTVLESVQERLWVPRHVAWEFLRRRPTVIIEGQNQENKWDDNEKKLREDVQKYLNSRKVDRETVDKALDEVQAVFDGFRSWISALDSEDPPSLRDDPILRRLEDLLDGRVGPEVDTQTLTEWEEEAARRIRDKVPPGYKDADKEDNAAGDYIIWAQMLDYAKLSNRPMLSVTDDRKEDRYWKFNGRTIGPRVELIEEFSLFSDETFWQLSLDSFLFHAKRTLGSETGAIITTPNAIASAGRARKIPMNNWDPDSYQNLLTALSQEGYEAQRAVIQEAARAGGWVSRDGVYAIIGRSEDQTLARFSLPAKRISLDLNLDFSLHAPPMLAVSASARPGHLEAYEVPAEFYFFENNLIHEWVEWDGYTDPLVVTPPEELD